ncbi:MAG: DUF4338 domain-containing protein [Bryobacteraceae bacterium]|nr:DUF4338 domain-containing protein [Bryobacteraceae bacterium]
MRLIATAQHWRLSHRADPNALPLADRHYNRQKPGTPQFVPPGRCIVLLTTTGDAWWVSSWPFAEYVKHQWAGAWICSLFRNESTIRSSDLIRDAVAITRQIWGDAPAIGMVTFVNTAMVRKKRDFGRCYRRAGWRPCGTTKGGLLALRIAPEQMPAPLVPVGAQDSLSLIA